MNIVESVKTVFSKYATFSGRASRSEFWWWILAIYIVQLVFAALMFGSVDWSAMMSDDPAAAMDASMGMYTSPFGILAIIWSLATLIPTLAVGARRLHDTGKTGWLQLLWLLAIIPFVGLIIIIVMIVLYALKGTEGDNKYGAPVI